MNDPTPTDRMQASMEGDTLVIRISGEWRITEKRPVLSALVTDQKFTRLRVMADGLGAWDSSLALFLRDAGVWAETLGMAVEWVGLPLGATQLTSLLAQKHPKPAVPKSALPNLFTAVGLTTFALWQEIKDLSGLVGECTYSMSRFLRAQAQFRWRDFLLEVQQCGVMALPIVGLISYLVGITLAYIASTAVRQYGGDILVADIVGLAVTREMGPMMAAIVLAGRTGAAFAATLGNMKANEEIDALSTLGVSPIDFLVMPRILALFCMMPFLALYSDCMGLLGGMTIAALKPLNIPPNLYWAETQTIVDLSDINTGLIKAGTFGLLIGLAGCLRGLQADRSAVGVGVAATRAVVTAILLIIVSDSVFAVVFNILGW